MIISASQPCYLPWGGFYSKIINSDMFVILDGVDFEKGSYTNRTKIKTKNGKKWLTIPVKVKLGDKIKDIETCREPWIYEHAATLVRNYLNAPYFQFPGVNYSGSWSLISALLDNMWAGFPRDSEIFRTTPMIRQSYIGVTGHKQDLIINLCRHYNADVFLFGAMGRDYVDEDYFNDAGIECIFQDFECIEYPQQWGGPFIPGLSIIDALFNVGPEKTLDLIKGGYKLPAKYVKGEGK